MVWRNVCNLKTLRVSHCGLIFQREDGELAHGTDRKERTDKISLLRCMHLKNCNVLTKSGNWSVCRPFESCNTENILVIFDTPTYGFFSPMVFYLFGLQVFIYSVVLFWSSDPSSKNNVQDTKQFVFSVKLQSHLEQKLSVQKYFQKIILIFLSYSEITKAGLLYSEDLKSYPSKSRNIQNLDFMKIRFQMVWKPDH